MAYDVITGSASFSGLTLDEAQSATAVFRDAIARVAGVDIERVTILGIEASVRRRLTDTVVVNFEVRATAEERAAVDANLLRAEADPALLDAALQAAAVDAGEAALFADVKTQSFSTDAEAPPAKSKKKKAEWSLGRWIRRNKAKLWFIIIQWILVALAGLCFLACTYKILRGTVEENCARWRKRSKAPKVKPGATPVVQRKKPWYSSSKKTKPTVKPVPSTRPDRARRPPPPSSSEEELSDKEAPRATRRSARKTPRRSPRRSARRRRRLDDDDDDDDDDGRFAGRLVDHTTRRRPVDKPPSIFGAPRPPAYSSDDDDEDDDDLERARGRSRRRRFGGPVNRVSDYDQSSDDDSEEYDLPGPPPARRLEMSAAKARSPPMRPPMPPPSPAFPSAFVASRPLYRK